MTAGDPECFYIVGGHKTASLCELRSAHCRAHRALPPTSGFIGPASDCLRAVALPLYYRAGVPLGMRSPFLTAIEPINFPQPL